MLQRILLATVLVTQLGLCALVAGADKKLDSASNRSMSTQDRFALIRGLNAEFVFVRRVFPMGTKGLTIKNGVVTPSEHDVQFMAAQYGPAARPGDRAQITDVAFKGNSIIFEINGGAKKKNFHPLDLAQRLDTFAAGDGFDDRHDQHVLVGVIDVGCHFIFRQFACLAKQLRTKLSTQHRGYRQRCAALRRWMG